MTSATQNDAAALPPRLEEIIGFFEMLPEPEKRMNLIAYADHLPKHAPPAGVEMDLSDIRKDQECQDTVGIFLKFRPDGERLDFYISVGEKAQTLTRALASILCEGLSGATADEVVDLPANFVPRIVGTTLFRQRSQTVYYVLTRMKNAVKAWRKQKIRGEIAADAEQESASSCGQQC